MTWYIRLSNACNITGKDSLHIRSIRNLFISSRPTFPILEPVMLQEIMPIVFRLLSLFSEIVSLGGLIKARVLQHRHTSEKCASTILQLRRIFSWVLTLIEVLIIRTYSNPRARCLEVSSTGYLAISCI